MTFVLKIFHSDTFTSLIHIALSSFTLRSTFVHPSFGLRSGFVRASFGKRKQAKTNEDKTTKQQKIKKLKTSKSKTQWQPSKVSSQKSMGLQVVFPSSRLVVSP